MTSFAAKFDAEYEEEAGMNRVKMRLMKEMQEGQECMKAEKGWINNMGVQPDVKFVDVQFGNGAVWESFESENLGWWIPDGKLGEFHIKAWRPSKTQEEQGYDLTEFREEIPELMGKVFPEYDAVNPKHYKDIVPGYEYFDVMDYMLADWHGSQAHALGNALKYLMRLNKKDSIPQELGKAIWYLERLKKDIEEKGKL